VLKPPQRKLQSISQMLRYKLQLRRELLELQLYQKLHRLQSNKRQQDPSTLLGISRIQGDQLKLEQLRRQRRK
jgi:hypothetical protein